MRRTSDLGREVETKELSGPCFHHRLHEMHLQRHAEDIPGFVPKDFPVSIWKTRCLTGPFLLVVGNES